MGTGTAPAGARDGQAAGPHGIIFLTPDKSIRKDEKNSAMICEIVHDPLFLSMPSSEATEADLSVAADLADTLRANLDRCVGMAANMIGKRKRIIAIAKGPMVVTMLNPKILSASGEYETEEGCLSLEGTRKTKRYRSIRLQWQDARMKTHVGTLDGFQAQIVQHEIDHCNGVLV